MGIFVNLNDSLNRWSVETIFSIVALIKKYCDDNNIYGAELCSVEDNTWTDTINKRYDVEIRYHVEGQNIQQKLLILKGEVIDGAAFHKRYSEFYPK